VQFATASIAPSALSATFMWGGHDKLCRAKGTVCW